MQKLELQKSTVDSWMQEHGASFTVTRHGQDQIVRTPYDPIPRVLPSKTFSFLEQGLIQRVNAINLFLNDIYHDRMILRDRVIPEEFIYASPDFHVQCIGIQPPKGIYTHVVATDLLCASDGSWYVIEDCLSRPDGIIYPHLARKLCREAAPEEFNVKALCDNCGLDILLKQLYRDIKDHDPFLSEGLVVMLASDKDAFELQYLADLTGATVASADQLIVMDNRVFYRAPEGGYQKVSVLHRLTSGTNLDPLCFDPDTSSGIPHLMEVYAAGNIAIINAPGCSVAEDLGLAALVPDMIHYYLDEDPILPAVPTYLPWYEDQREYILTHLEKLIVKEVGSSSRNGAIFPASMTSAERKALAERITHFPRYFIAQEILNVERLPLLSTGNTVRNARCDLRAYTVHSDSLRVWMGGLTRWTAHEENGESISGFKDTWVMNA